MKLNKELPGLPDWPPIHLNKDRMEYVVGGPHLSYPSYDRGRKSIGAIVLGGLLFGFIIGFTVSMGLGTLIVLACFASIPILSVFPLFKAICEAFFSTNVQVRFGRESFHVNGQTYENRSGVSAQFRAQRSPLPEEQIQRNEELRQQGKLPKSRAYDYKFRKVEMIYGSKIVLITSLADEDRAAQFAIALQIGYDLSQSFDLSEVTASPIGRPSRESLPE